MQNSLKGYTAWSNHGKLAKEGYIDESRSKLKKYKLTPKGYKIGKLIIDRDKQRKKTVASSTILSQMQFPDYDDEDDESKYDSSAPTTPINKKRKYPPKPLRDITNAPKEREEDQIKI